MIIIRPWVRMTPTIQRVIDEIEPHANEAQVEFIVTSGFRDPAAQLLIISGYAAEHGISFPEFNAKNVYEETYLDDAGEMVYCWQRTWSELLRNTGTKPPSITINPPLDAKCLTHYINAQGEDMYGKVIHATIHITGTAFDSQGDGNLKDQIDEIPKKIDVLKKAQAAGAHVRSWTIERKQNCLHVNCIKNEEGKI